MRARELAEAFSVWRIGDPDGRFPICSGDGAALCEGRWHSKRQGVIYTAEHYGTAMLEKLVHYNGVMPPQQHFVKIRIPAGVGSEEVTKDSLPNWDRPDAATSREFGSAWFEELRTCLLIVPSYVSREEKNVLINPNHPDAKKIRPGREKPIRWDDRLFKS